MNIPETNQFTNIWSDINMVMIEMYSVETQRNEFKNT